MHPTRPRASVRATGAPPQPSVPMPGTTEPTDSHDPLRPTDADAVVPTPLPVVPTPLPVAEVRAAEPDVHVPQRTDVADPQAESVTPTDATLGRLDLPISPQPPAETAREISVTVPLVPVDVVAQFRAEGAALRDGFAADLRRVAGEMAASYAASLSQFAASPPETLLRAAADRVAAAPPSPATAQSVADALWQRLDAYLADRLQRAHDDLRATLTAERGAEMRQFAETLRLAPQDHPLMALTLGDDGRPISTPEMVPVIRVIQKRKHLDHPPRPLPGGDVAIYHNYDPTEGQTSSEINLSETGVRVVDTGFRVEVPEGWLADVSTAGLEGQRVVCATLAGSTHPDLTLVLRLRSNTRRHIPAGTELCRLHLRRSAPAAVLWTDTMDRQWTVSADGTLRRLTAADGGPPAVTKSAGTAGVDAALDGAE